ncbi:MAG: SUKH-4 family immunity protein [Planctomycetota bacterium]|nr:SUKH-4 family immunity protein [Planctomycetota bacterium]
MLVLPTDARAFWGEALSPWTPASLAGLGLPPEQVTYLRETGLPARVGPGSAWKAPPGAPARVPGATELVVVGHDFETPVCVDTSRRGHVVQVHDARAPLQHVNAHVIHLGGFLMVYECYRRAVAMFDPADEAGAQALIDRIEAAWRGIDAGAFQHDETYWSNVLEQMRDGLL